MTINADQIARSEPKRDRYGRYVVEDPTGKTAPYTRATTISKAIEDQYNLSMWRCRKVLEGAVGRKDIIASAQAHSADNDRNVYDELVQKALDAAASDAAASTGTALHRFTEDVDSGNKTIDDIPEDWRPLVSLYRTTLAEAGVEIDPNHIEAVLLDDTHRIAGTADRIVTLADGRRIIADLKTSKNISYSTLAFSIQLAIYANHTATYDYATGARGPRIDVDTNQAMIIHLPSQGPEHGTCQLYMIDVREGAQAMLAALEVRDMRKTSRNWLSKYQPVNPGTGGATAQTDWIRDRIGALAGNGPAVSQLVKLWPAGIPKPLPEVLDNDQITEFANALDIVEAQHQIAFGQPRPGVEHHTSDKKAA